MRRVRHVERDMAFGQMRGMRYETVRGLRAVRDQRADFRANPTCSDGAKPIDPVGTVACEGRSMIRLTEPCAQVCRLGHTGCGGLPCDERRNVVCCCGPKIRIGNTGERPGIPRRPASLFETGGRVILLLRFDPVQSNGPRPCMFQGMLP